MIDIKIENGIKLSASKVKVWESCSWVYNCKYNLKLPDKSNDGAIRGTVAHLILEILINFRHKKHIDLILLHNNIEGSKAVFRLVQKAAKREKLDLSSIENSDILNSIILVGLKYEFFGHSDLSLVKDVKTEGEFNIELTKDVLINGFIDKIVTFNDNSLAVKDYKGSKKRFNGDEIAYNVQALMYSLAIWKKTGVIPEVEFLFLRFPKKTSQKTKKCTVEELLGFEEYLLFLAEAMKNFTIKDATSNLAVNNIKTQWMCGSTEPGKWCCSFRKPQIFYSVKDKDGKQKKVYFEVDKKNIKLGEGEKIYKLTYNGCPAFKNEKPPEERKELLDF